ncbi:hypothetical protein NQ314_001672 [Rhamnusium bicolor]|uniref:Uncharacterized protein n=1 Tax=Rhamnusium bicolor TaxID=1586634 RepID=A0AAV8ZS09_9CUCU|nr:hypothetical protein NQ314_001672 [Rhamnusium bicolor]
MVSKVNPDEEYEELVENESNDEPASEDNLPSTSADYKNQQNNKPRCSNEGIKEKKKKGNFETTGKCMLICTYMYLLVSKITWKKTKLLLNQQQLQFHGDPSLSSNILELDGPYEFFNYFFTDEILHRIVDETNLFSIQKDPNNS